MTLLYLLLFITVPLLAGDNSDKTPLPAQITFDHSPHILKEEMDCSDCHEGIEDANTIGEMPSITGETCADCHDTVSFPEVVQNTRRLSNSFRLPHLLPAGNVLFSHKIHLENDLKCSSCHAKVLKRGLPSADMPKMSTCVSCHEEQRNAPEECSSCHAEVLAPLDHSAADWMRSAHAQESALRPTDCTACHETENDCSSCHMGNEDVNIHPPAYEFTHGIDVRFRILDCSTCHQPVERFCADCHQTTSN